MRVNLLRHTEPNQHARVGFIELFFDLVFVFAITQLSHTLLENLSPLGAFQTLILFSAVWWAWIDTAWVTNWLDPQQRPVRLMLFVVMLAGLVLSTSLPEAYGDRGLYFACAYAAIQLVRSLFTVWAMKGRSEANYRNFQRITAWIALFSVFWVAGGLADGWLRLALWVVAVIIENIGPSVRFWTPWMGRSDVADWRVEGGHMAERCGLFIIIALGESILATGGAFSHLAWNATTVTAFVIAFVGSVAMWWIYFDSGQERGSDRIAHAVNSGALARLAYTYIHIPIVIGIVVCAVADEIILMHPAGHADAAAIAVILGGPAIYLVGTLFFRWAVAAHIPRSQIIGLAVLAALALPAAALSPLMLSALTTLILVAVAAVEWWWMRREQA